MGLGDRAVVIGAGMGGLFAAAAASPHFEEVLILDRDEPAGPVPRKSVPQGHHFHVLLPGGMDSMSTWFPGFADDLVAAGSIPMIAGRDFYVFMEEGKSYSMLTYDPNPADGDLMYVQSRPLLEDRVRSRVLGLGNVSARHRVVVDQPIVEDGRVCGVTTKDDESITADLVIDASGRNSCTARWLEPLGYDLAPESHINCEMQYVSALVEPDDWDFFDGVVFFLMPTKKGEFGNRGGAVIKLEDGKWLMQIGSRHGDYCPTDWESMLAYGETLVSPEWTRCAETVTPISEVQSYRMPRAIRRHYEQVERFPDGLLPMGDSICFYNPTYGQGMSAAAGQCRGLRELFQARETAGTGIDGLALEFFPVANEWVRGPWSIAAMGDLDFEGCTGDFPNGELEDLMRFQQAVEAAATNQAALDLVADLMTLRVPLSSVNDVELV